MTFEATVDFEERKTCSVRRNKTLPMWVSNGTTPVSQDTVPDDQKVTFDSTGSSR